MKYMNTRGRLAQKPRILLILTGGTITMIRGENGSLRPCDNPEKLIQEIPVLKKLAEIDILPVINVDSSDIVPSHWVEIANAIFQRIKDYDGFVVTHGTDTLCYTASALSFFLQELNKPVVVTGAQVPLDEIGTDGRTNLINAIRVAISDIAEVVVVFGSLIIRGVRARKASAFDMQSFVSINDVPLGNIGLTIKYASFAKPRSRKKPILKAQINPNVVIFPVYPGIKPEVFNYLSEHHDGIILLGYGAGNIPTGENSLIPAISAAVKRNVPVIIATQCVVGSTDMELYNVGRAALEVGAIPAMDMTPEATCVKLMWVLAQTSDISTVESMMNKNFVGELHEPA